MTRTGVSVGLLLLVGACGVWTDTTMLDPQTAMIGGRGGVIHSQGEVTKSLLQEASKLALQKGFCCFAVIQGTDWTTTAAIVNAGPTTYMATGPGTVIATPGPMMITPAAMPAGDIMVRFYKDPPDGVTTWNARQILATP